MSRPPRNTRGHKLRLLDYGLRIVLETVGNNAHRPRQLVPKVITWISQCTDHLRGNHPGGLVLHQAYSADKGAAWKEDFKIGQLQEGHIDLTQECSVRPPEKR